MTKLQHLTGWITYAQSSVDLGVVPGPSVLLNPYLVVTTGFNAAGTDLLSLGTPDDADAFGLDKDVSSTILTPADFSAGGSLGYRAAGTLVRATYAYTSTAPTQGRALVVQPYIRVPLS